MENLKIFPNKEFGSIRVIVIKNETWFVGKDIAIALGYARPDNAVVDRVDEDDRLFLDRKLVLKLGISFDHKELGQRGGWIVNESGMYALIFDSKLESAKKFKKWVTSEVLPQIRKTGQYGQPRLPQNTMELLELHYKALKEVDEKVNTVSDEVKTVKEELETLKFDLPILPIEADKITEAVKKKGVAVLGGKQSSAYNNRNLRQKLYNNLYANLKYNFGVKSYKSIKRSQCDKAIEIITRYEPPFFLAGQIEAENAQMNMKDL